MSRESSRQHREERERRRRGLRRARSLIILAALVAFLVVTPGARQAIGDFLHLDDLLLGSGSLSERFTDYLASFREDPIISEPNLLLVNFENPLPEGYEAGELVCLYEQRHSFQLASADIYMEKNTYEAMERMFAAAEKDGVNDFIITSGYRTPEKQAQIYAESGAGLASQPGYSEHQTGLAFDVTTWNSAGGFQHTNQYAWLIKHCADYGFILRYPEGKTAITGIETEYWHYRYVGTEAAREIMRQGITLEEYLAQ